MRDASRSIGTAAAGHVALVAVALSVWGASLTGADLSRISGVGLLSALPPGYFVAFGLLLTGGAVALTRSRVSPAVLALYVVALVLVVHGTAPLLYDEPRYPWVYKHVAVVDLIARTGHVDRATDIYNNWPAFFALNAWISSVSGLPALAYAAWAQVFFNLAYAAAVLFAVRGVSASDRVAWVATWLFLLGNWVGQDYLAPQAFAFLLALVLLGLCLRCSPPPVPARSRAGRWWAARLDGFRDAVLRRPADREPLPPAPLSPRAALLLGTPCYLALVVSHQLTPVMLLAGVTALAVFARRVPLWIPAAMALVEGWWIALSWRYVTAHYDLFSIDPTSSGAPPGYQAGHGLSGLGLVVNATHAQVVLVAALAVAALVRRIREGRWDLPAVLLIVAPLVVVALQSYSGEGRYRFYLFALPWLSYLAATSHRTIAGSSRGRRALSRGGLLVVTGALGAGLLFAYFGLELSNRVTASDVAAGVWFDEHAPASSLVVEVTPDSVSRITARYATVFDPAYPGAPTLTDQARFRRHRLGTTDLPAIEATLRGYGVKHTFLLVNGAEQRFARLYGILPDGWASSLARALRGSPAFRPVYRGEDAWIFEYTPGDGGH
jgi:hypothetical protein